jgi:hypothetical protein
MIEITVPGLLRSAQESDNSQLQRDGALVEASMERGRDAGD